MFYVGKNMQSFSAIYYMFIRTYTIVRKVGVVARCDSLCCKDVRQFLKYSRRWEGDVATFLISSSYMSTVALQVFNDIWKKWLNDNLTIFIFPANIYQMPSKYLADIPANTCNMCVLYIYCISNTYQWNQSMCNV